MASHISADEAAQTFSDVLERVRTNGEVIVIECAGEPVCQISPIPAKQFTLADLARLLKTLPRPDDAFFDDVEEATRNEPTIPESPWE
jgi:antitoxin (DNA-binding transcriptional repressor) of toxin-antitoxin stability system